MTPNENIDIEPFGLDRTETIFLVGAVFFTIAVVAVFYYFFKLAKAEEKNQKS